MRILVTDAHELAGLGAVRSLGKAGHQVVAAYPERLQRPASTYSQYCNEHRTHPDPWLSQPDFCEWLLANAPSVDLVLPITEAAIVAAASCRSRLPSSATLIAPSAESLDYALSKRRATAQALAVELRCPRTAFSLDDVSGLTAPFVVRTDNRLMRDGSYRKGSNWRVDHTAHLMALLDELTESGEQWIVQEHIVGKGAGGFLLTWHGRTLLEFAHERVHEVPFYGGVSSLRKSVHDPAVIATAAKLLTSIRYDGVAMVEFRRAAADRVPYFVEINGRLWGSLALALHAGADFPARLVACYAGPSAQEASADYASGVYCRNVYPGELDYLRSVLSARGPVHGVNPPGRMRTVVEFFTLFFRPHIHYDYLWLRDPLPWLWQSIHALGHVARSRWDRCKRGLRQRSLLREFERRQRYAAPDVREVLFLCYGNICRSAFAGAYWNDKSGRLAQSAGFYPQANRRTPWRVARLSRDLGVDLVAHRSRIVDAAIVERATAIFVMDGQNIEDLVMEFPHARGKAWLLGSFLGIRAIRDPYLLSDAEAAKSLRQVRESIDAILQRQPHVSKIP